MQFRYLGTDDLMHELLAVIVTLVPLIRSLIEYFVKGTRHQSSQFDIVYRLYPTGNGIYRFSVLLQPVEYLSLDLHVSTVDLDRCVIAVDPIDVVVPLPYGEGSAEEVGVVESEQRGNLAHVCLLLEPLVLEHHETPRPQLFDPHPFELLRNQHRPLLDLHLHVFFVLVQMLQSLLNLLNLIQLHPLPPHKQRIRQHLLSLLLHKVRNDQLAPRSILSILNIPDEAVTRLLHASPPEDAFHCGRDALSPDVLVFPLLEDALFEEEGLGLSGLALVVLQDAVVALGVELVVLLALVVDLYALLYAHHHVVLCLCVFVLEILPLLVELGQLLSQLGTQLFVADDHQLLEEKVLVAVGEDLHHVVGRPLHQHLLLGRLPKPVEIFLQEVVCP